MQSEQQIKQERAVRADICSKEIQDILKKYEFAMVAEDNIGASTKINVNIQLVDLKKYDSSIAQEETPKVVLEESPKVDVTEPKVTDAIVIDPKDLE